MPACRVATPGTSPEDPFMNVPHLALFAAFILLVYIALGPVSARLRWAVAMTFSFGVVLEVQQAATRTGNCELVDLVPDALGALGGVVIILIFRAARRRLTAP